jgi:hypothetical protein
MSVDFSALKYLAAFDRNLPFESDMIYFDLLKKYRLDYSINSLKRIDQFLDEIREQEHPEEQNFLENHSKYSLLYLLCFYVGEVVGRARGTPFHWYSYQEKNIFGGEFYTTACCSFSSCPNKEEGSFLPLNVIITRMFDHDGKSIYSSAEIFLPSIAKDSSLWDMPLKKVPPIGLGIDIPRQLNLLSSEDQTYFHTSMPDWVINDDIARFFDQHDYVLETGKVVWAALIQANKTLFEIGDQNHGGEIVYDPEGRMPFADLRTVAGMLGRLKGKKNLDPKQKYIGDYLGNESSRVFGLDVPASILPYPLKISTTFFDRKHLPDGMVSLFYFPILLDQAGVAVVIPSKYWTTSFRQQWMDASEEQRISREKKARHRDVMQSTESVIIEEDGQLVVGIRRKQPEITEVERLFCLGVQFSEGAGVIQDYKQAYQYFFKAAQLGHGISLFNLGVYAERGLGVAENPKEAFDYYFRSAEKGDVNGQMRVAKLYIQGYGVDKNLAQAKWWFTQAADQGNEEAKKILIDYAHEFFDSKKMPVKRPHLLLYMLYSMSQGFLFLSMKVLDLFQFILGGKPNDKNGR